jgi:hypothetical protein
MVEENYSMRITEEQLKLNLKMVEDNFSIWSLKYNFNSTWQLEIPDGYFQLQILIAKEARRCCREEGSEESRDRKWKLKHKQC